MKKSHKPASAARKPAIKASKLGKARKASKPASAAKKSQPPQRAIGKLSGLSVRETWKKLFASNEKAKLPDEKLLAQMFREFPDKKGAGIRDYTLEGIQAVRRWINSGRMDGTAHSFKRYGPDKKPLLRRASEG